MGAVRIARFYRAAVLPGAGPDGRDVRVVFRHTVRLVWAGRVAPVGHRRGRSARWSASLTRVRSAGRVRGVAFRFGDHAWWVFVHRCTEPRRYIPGTETGHTDNKS